MTLPEKVVRIAAFALFGLCISPLFAETIRINSNDAFPRSAPDKSGFEDRILTEAFKRIGAAYELVRVPSERALNSVDRGEIDGDYVRIAGLESAYPNLVMVEEPIAAMEFGTFTRNRDFIVSSWNELKHHSFGRIIGWKIVERNTEGFDRAAAVRDENALFELLRSGRVDAIVYDLLQGRLRLKASGDQGVIFPGPALERREMYLYLHKRHERLARELAAALREMKKEGIIEAITADALRRAGLDE